MEDRKGIILAGGLGTRLYPVTLSVSKQLLPVYDKPMIYYPLSILMLAGIREIAIINTPEDQNQFKNLMGDGSQWGVTFTYIKQPSPEGLAQSFILAEDFLSGSPSVMVLGDNIFFGNGLSRQLILAKEQKKGATVFGCQVEDPERYGVIEFGDEGQAVSIIEKPEYPPSNYAVTGLYFVDESASQRAKQISPSDRGELEIASLLNMYLEDDILSVKKMDRGDVWFDTGTHNSLLEASDFVRSLQSRQGLQLGCPEEIAFMNQWISVGQLEERADLFSKSSYGEYLKRLININ